MFEFTPWPYLRVGRDDAAISRFLNGVGYHAATHFRQEMLGPKTGIHWPTLPNRSSAVGEYPANQSGKLRRSINYSVGNDEVAIGSNVYYSRDLREGTARMYRRKMSDDALHETLPESMTLLSRWFVWKK